MKDLCPLCGAAATAPARHRLLVICKACGLLHDRSIAVPGVLVRMEDEWFGGETRHIAQDPATRWLEAANARRTMRRANVTPGDRVLEVGVGTGGTLTFFARHNLAIEGCDISEPLAQRAEERSGRKVWACPVAEVPGEFDTIIASHVLEHQPKPVEFLRDLGGKLRPGGKVLVVVPNVASFDARSARWISYQPYHLVYFTPETLRAAAVAAGLQVVRQGTYESITAWPLLARHPRSEPARRGSNRESSNTMLVRTAGIAIGLALSPLRWLAAAVGRGDEAYALLRRQ